jgi:hypothetical protein
MPPSAESVRVPGSHDGRRGQVENATGPDVVGFACVPKGRVADGPAAAGPTLAMAWETGELALAAI